MVVSRQGDRSNAPDTPRARLEAPAGVHLRAEGNGRSRPGLPMPGLWPNPANGGAAISLRRS